jgi:hypothetical protein
VVDANDFVREHDDIADDAHLPQKDERRQEELTRQVCQYSALLYADAQPCVSARQFDIGQRPRTKLRNDYKDIRYS